MTIGVQVGIRVGLTDLTPENFPPIAAFTFDATALEVVFTDGSSDLEGAISSWAWNFGDGALSSSQNPTHEYAGAGTYTVTLTVRDVDGATAQISHDVEVTAQAWSVDATRGVGVPADSTEWTAFMAANPSLTMGSPSDVWLFQDASGNLAAAVGGKTLTVVGTLLYEQTETGWARKFITNSTASGANRSAENSSMVAATTSTLLLGYMRIVQPVLAHQRMCYGGSSNNALEAIAASPNIRYRTGGSAANGSLSHVGAVRPFVLLHDTSGAGRMALFTDIEKVSPAYAARAGTTARWTWSIVTDLTSNMAVGYGAAWSGAAIDGLSDAQIKALLEALGWVISGW